MTGDHQNVSGWRRETLAGFAVLLGATLGLRLWGLGYPPFYDEGFHVLAARSWLERGTFCIADCLQPYDRASIFTWLVTASLALFGDSIESARLPSVVAGTLLVAAVFVWVRREISPRAAWIAAGLCAVGPELIGWSQTARFYALQALLVFCGVALFYSGVTGGGRRFRIGAVFAAIACFLVSLNLQISTLIPAAALGLWLVGWMVAHRSSVSERTQIVLAAGAVALGLALALWQWPTLGQMWNAYRGEGNLHNLADANNPFFYHSWFVRMYSYLYALFPVAVVLAIARGPRPALLLTSVFVTAFVAHSFGGFKGDRLILYAFPFFFTIWAIALAEILPALSGHFRTAARAVVPGEHSRLVRVVATAGLGVALIFAALNTDALQTTVRILTVPSSEWSGEPWYRGSTDWAATRPELDSLLQGVDIVVSSSEIKTLYELGRTDVSLSRTELVDAAGFGADPAPEFWQYPITGRRVISSPASVRRLVSCYSSGMFLVETGHWRLPAVVTQEAADAIEQATTEVDLPSGTRALAFVWHTEPGAMGDDCAGGMTRWAALAAGA